MSIIKPVLKRLHSPDADDLGTVVFGESGRHCILLQAMFGPSEGKGEESFDIIVCDFCWIANQVKRDGIVWPQHHLVVNNFDIKAIHVFLSNFAERCAGETWREVATKLGRLGHWEFEDYRP